MRLERQLTQLALCITVAGAGLTLAACGSDANDAGGENGTQSTASGNPSGSGSSEAVDICTKVTAAEISKVLGAPVTSEAVPGGGCNFANADDPRAASISLSSSVVDEAAGGFDGSVAGVSATLQGDAGGPLDGVGDQAYVKTGSFAGSEIIRGGGLVRVGTNLVQVTLSPDQGTSAVDVQAIVVDTLNLVASRL